MKIVLLNLLLSMASLPYTAASANAVATFATFLGWGTAFASKVDNNHNTKNLRSLTSKGEDVYRLSPSEILDTQLDAFSIEPILEQPGRWKIDVPHELSSDPQDPNWVFEGYLRRLSREESAVKDSKRESIRKYFARLNDSERVELKERLETRRIARAREAAVTRRVAFDERKQVAIAVLEDFAVWSLRAPPNRDPKSEELAEAFVGNTTLVDYDGDYPNHNKNSDFGMDLELVSGYNGYDMTSYPWRAQGCLSTSTSSSGCMCSGTKISARLVLTAGHCLTDGVETWSPYPQYWLSGADGVYWMMVGGDDTPNGARGWSEWIVSPEWFYYEEGTHDWGLFVLTPETDNCDLGWFGYQVEENLLNVDVNVFGYPASSCENSPVSSGECTNSIYGRNAGVYWENSTMFAYSIDTQGGMSGSGVYAFYNDGQRRVVGVHVRGSALDDVYGIATRINDDVFSMIETIREQYPDSSAGC